MAKTTEEIADAAKDLTTTISGLVAAASAAVITFKDSFDLSTVEGLAGGVLAVALAVLGIASRTKR